MDKELEKKIKQAIRLIQSTCANKDDVEVAYSGGKDSDVILQLAKEAGIKFTARYKNTTIDPPGTIQHCREMGVEILNPKESFFSLIKKKGYPNRFRRFCCAALKEYPTDSNTVIVGVRREESKARANRYKEPTICRIYSKQKRVQQILPILYWTKDDVQNFLQDRNIKVHPLYYTNGVLDVTKRLGCVGCPLTTPKKRIKEFCDNPKMLRAWVNAGEQFYKDKIINQYEAMVQQLFYKTMREFMEIQNGLFGKMDCKEVLERLFNIKL